MAAKTAIEWTDATWSPLRVRVKENQIRGYENMADQKQQASQASDIIGVMADLNRGNFMIECGRQLQEATDAIVRTGKKAKLTITLEIIPAGMRDGRINQFEISPSVTIKEPQESQGTSIFFVSEQGRLTRNDPNQENFGFEKEQSNVGS